MNVADRAVLTQKVLARDDSLRRLSSTLHKTFCLADHRTVQVISVNDGYEATRGRSPDNLYRIPRDWLDGIFLADRERIEQTFVTDAPMGS